MTDPTPTTSAERDKWVEREATNDPDELERELEAGAAVLHSNYDDPTPTTSAERDDDIAFANADEAVAYLGSEWVKAQAERVAALEAVAAVGRRWAQRRREWAECLTARPLDAQRAAELTRGCGEDEVALIAALATLDEHA